MKKILDLDGETKKLNVSTYDRYNKVMSQFPRDMLEEFYEGRINILKPYKKKTVQLTEEFDVFKLREHIKFCEDSYKKNLRRYIKHSRKGKVKIIYSIPEYGRLKPDFTNDEGFINSQSYQWKNTKYEILRDIYDDVDMVNCQTTLYLQLLKHHNIKAPNIKLFTDERENILKNLIKFKYVEDRASAKKEIYSIMFSDDDLLKKKLEKTKNYPEIPLIKRHIDEILTTRIKILEIYPQFRGWYKKRWNSHETHKNPFNVNGGPLAHLCQHLERIALLSMYDYFTKNKMEVGALIHDGLHLKKNKKDRDRGDIIKGCEEHVYRDTGFKIKLSIKPFKKEVIEKTDKDLQIEKMINRTTPVTVCNYVYKYVKDKAVCVDMNTKKCFVFNGVKWVEDDGHISLIKEIRSNFYYDLDEYALKFKNRGAVEKIKFQFERCIFFDGILKNLYGKIYDIDFYSKMDVKPHLIGFNNGVYDLLQKKFRKGRYDDYISLSVGYDYKEKGEYYDKVTEFYEKIYPSDEIRKYISDVYALSLSGYQRRKHVNLHLGDACVGKSTMFDFLKETLGDYCQYVAPTFFTGKKSKSGDPDVVLASLRGVRLVYTEELEGNEKLKNGRLKQLADGGVQKPILKYSNKQIIYKSQTKIHALNNKMINLDGGDMGIKRRILLPPYDSLFVENAKKQNEHEIDYYICDKFKLWRYDHINYLIENFNKNEIMIPKRILAITDKFLNNNNDIKQFVIENLEITGDEEDVEKFVKIKELYRYGGYDQNNLKDLKNLLEKELGLECHGRTRIDGRQMRNVFRGIRVIDTE